MGFGCGTLAPCLCILSHARWGGGGCQGALDTPCHNRTVDLPTVSLITPSSTHSIGRVLPMFVFVYGGLSHVIYSSYLMPTYRGSRIPAEYGQQLVITLSGDCLEKIFKIIIICWEVALVKSSPARSLWWSISLMWLLRIIICIGYSAALQ